MGRLCYGNPLEGVWEWRQRAHKQHAYWHAQSYEARFHQQHNLWTFRLACLGNSILGVCTTYHDMAWELHASGHPLTPVGRACFLNLSPLQTEKYYDLMGTSTCALLALDSLRKGSPFHARKVRQPAAGPLGKWTRIQLLS